MSKIMKKFHLSTFFESARRAFPPPVKVHFTVTSEFTHQNAIFLGHDSPIKAFAPFAAQYVVMIARSTVSANHALKFKS